MKYFILILFLSFSYASFSQQPEEETGKIFEANEVMEQAEFPGGMDGLHKFLVKNLNYPKECSKNNIQGKVFVEFVVGSDGKVSNAKIKRGVNPDLDAESLRVVSLMPDWTPAIIHGKSVKMRYVLPINFIASVEPDKKNEKRGKIKKN